MNEFLQQGALADLGAALFGNGGDRQQQTFAEAAFARLCAQEVPTPQERKQAEIASKNHENYARWLTRMARDPLADCVAISNREVMP